MTKVTMRSDMNDDNSSCCSTPSQQSENYATVSSSSSASSLSYLSSKKQGQLTVSFATSIQVRSIVKNENDNDNDKWYSPEELQEAEKAVMVTIREMRSPEKKIQRGLCSRGLENIKSAEHVQARWKRRDLVVGVVLETAGEEQRAQAAQSASRSCRQRALELAAQDEAFVQSTFNLDKVMETIQREHQAANRTVILAKATGQEWQSTLTTPVREPLSKDRNEIVSNTASPVISSLLVPSKTKRWVSFAMRNPSRRPKQQRQKRQFNKTSI